jgi:hypothetical protein
MITATAAFECPHCGRKYRLALDPERLERLQRDAVCGRCRQRFSLTFNVSNKRTRARSEADEIERLLVLAQHDSGFPPAGSDRPRQSDRPIRDRRAASVPRRGRTTDPRGRMSPPWAPTLPDGSHAPTVEARKPRPWVDTISDALPPPPEDTPDEPVDELLREFERQSHPPPGEPTRRERQATDPGIRPKTPTPFRRVTSPPPISQPEPDERSLTPVTAHVIIEVGPSDGDASEVADEPRRHTTIPGLGNAKPVHENADGDLVLDDSE